MSAGILSRSLGIREDFRAISYNIIFWAITNNWLCVRSDKFARPSIDVDSSASVFCCGTISDKESKKRTTSIVKHVSVACNIVMATTNLF